MFFHTFQLSHLLIFFFQIYLATQIAETFCIILYVYIIYFVNKSVMDKIC